ncbi:MAG: hypothetical protein QG622_3749 [Actinomycetota bacterium]|nr:hypothetical protein [Actinomycetota bacterium]
MSPAAGSTAGPGAGARPGDVVVRRQFENDYLGRVWAGRVVSDDERGLAVWIADGSTVLDVIAADGRAFVDVPFEDWGAVAKKLEPFDWSGNALMLHPPGEGFSIWWFFAPDGGFRGWYVNLERPATRWSDGALAGIDTVDHDIDIVVSPERAWTWKDEDQFERGLAYDHYWVKDPDAVRAAGARAVDLVSAGTAPFDGSWCDFRPPSSWGAIPELPAGWDRPKSFR